MEISAHISQIDKLRDLENKPLFWFLKGKDFQKLQHEIRAEKFNFGSVNVETLASDAENKLNEDAPLVLDFGKGRTFISVLDGASSQKDIEGLKEYGIKGAFYVSHLAAYGFGRSEQYRNLCQKEDLGAGEILSSLNSWIKQELEKVTGIDYNNVLYIPGMAAVGLLVDPKNKQVGIVQVADSMAASISSDGTVKVLTPNLNEKFDTESMEFAQNLAEKNNMSLYAVRQDKYLNAEIKGQLAGSFIRKINKEGGCGVLNGMPELFENKLVYTDILEMNANLSSILLFSDGAVLPHTGMGVPYEKSVEGLVDAVYSNRPGSVLERGADILNADPEWEKISRLKHRDDATIIEVRFN